MSKGEKLFRFLASLMLDRFYGKVTIRFEAGKVTHVETETRCAWQYKELPDAKVEGVLSMDAGYRRG
jgi:hypothetical protein